MLLPHPSDTLFVQFHHFSCPVWRVKSLRQGLCIHCSSTFSPNTVDGSARGSAVISLQGHKGLFSCVSLSWFGVGRARCGALPGLVKCKRRKSIGQKVQTRFLAAPNTAPSLPRRKQSREVEKKTHRPCSLCVAEQTSEAAHVNQHANEAGEALTRKSYHQASRCSPKAKRSISLHTSIRSSGTNCARKERNKKGNLRQGWL